MAVDGGALRIFSPEESFVDISPSRGTLVVFRSDSVPHEVLESHRARLAVVGWFRVKGVDFGEIVAAGERLERLGYDAAAAQIYLRLASESDLSPEEKAYAWFRRAHALHDGCGDAEGAVEAYENALTHDTSSQMARDGLAILRGEHDDLFRHNSFAVESRDWLLSIASGERESFVGLGTRRVLEIAARHAGKGLVLEFGVYLGRSLKMLSELMETNNVAADFHGFDSFQGLPEDWMPGEPKGAYSTRGKTPDHVDATFHVGWFDETLERFEVGDRRVALVHLDCDLYSSTKTVLDALGPKLEKGAVLVFDDFLNHPQWQSDQKRAFEEAVSHFGWTYDLLAADILTKQLVIQLT